MKTNEQRCLTIVPIALTLVLVVTTVFAMVMRLL